jgi:hypothetical protein
MYESMYFRLNEAPSSQALRARLSDMSAVASVIVIYQPKDDIYILNSVIP